MIEDRKYFALSALLLASACAPMGAAWSPEQSPMAVTTQVVAENYVVKLDKRAKGLRTGEQQELKAFLAHLGDLSTVESSLRRTHRDLSEAALVPVEKELIALGADSARVMRLAEIGFDYPGQWADVEIIAKRYLASAPGCPDWSHANIGDNLNENSSNFGCATNSALALSIADPRDLDHGREIAPAPGTHAQMGTNRYNTDNVKPLHENSSRTEQK